MKNPLPVLCHMLCFAAFGLAQDPGQLLAADVASLVRLAASAAGGNQVAIAVVDRQGRPLAVWSRSESTTAEIENALALARTGAFFSHDQAPLSSRTVLSLSTPNFPMGIPNAPAAALFGIENTNRGCSFSAEFNEGKFIPRATNLAGDGPSLGVITRPGGLPLYKNRVMVGGIGVAGVIPEAAEFTAVAAASGTGFFVPLPLPFPGAVFVDGFRLPFVTQTTRPAGFPAGSFDDGSYLVAPGDGAAVPDGWLVGPLDGVDLSAGQVREIVDNAVTRAGRTRGLIRLPLGSRSRMVVAVTGRDGALLGLFRMPDATVFSIDVAVAKARNVVYFSSPEIDPADLPGIPPGTAVTNRSIGFGSQPFFPSGIANSDPGPFRDLYEFDSANPCTQGRQSANPNQNGVVFFPGSAPLYRDGVLIGGLGVSGDGVEQDDWVTAAGASGYEPPPAIRADHIFIRGVRIPYWKFPRNPEQ